MSRVYQIVVGSNGERLTTGLRKAFDYVAALIHQPQEGYTSREITHPWWAEDLAAADLQGSLEHLVIRAARDHRLEVAIVEHDPSRAPNLTSEVRRYDFDDFDPSYLVQDALYQCGASEKSVIRIEESLATKVSNGVRSARLSGRSDNAILNDLLERQKLLMGIRVIEADGKPKAMLDGMADRCVTVFKAAYARAFKEEPALEADGPTM